MDLLDQKSLIEGFLRKERHCLSSFSFISLFAWKDFFRFETQVIDGALCVFAEDAAGIFLYLPPLGEKVSPATVNQCFEIMEKRNKGSGVSRIENVPGDSLEIFSRDDFDIYPKGDEYCYYRPDVAGLEGGAFKSRRSDYNQCASQNDVLIKPYQDEMYEGCLALYREWAQQCAGKSSDRIYLQMLEDNQNVHALLLRHQRLLGLTGRVVYIGRELKGYTFGYPLNEKMFCVLLEIADNSIRGLPTYLFRQFCLDPAVARFSFINAMDDMGREEMRQAKMSFRPRLFFSSYILTRKG